MKVVMKKVVLVLLAIVAVWWLHGWVVRFDARTLADSKHRIEACKAMGGHPVLYWHRGYGDWFLESCKL
jgi:hypothetical protein